MKRNNALPTLREYLKHHLSADATEEDIRRARQVYRRIYNRLQKRARRQEMKEITVRLTREEAKMIRQLAEADNSTSPMLIRDLVLRQIRKGIGVHEKKLLGQALLILSQCHDAINRSKASLAEDPGTINAYLTVLMGRIKQMETAVEGMVFATNEYAHSKPSDP